MDHLTEFRCECRFEIGDIFFKRYNPGNFYVGVQLLIQSLDLEEVATWRICMSFYFGSSPKSPRNNDHGTQLVRKNIFAPTKYPAQILSKIYCSTWIKSKTACIYVTWLLPPSLGTGSHKIFDGHSLLHGRLFRPIWNESVSNIVVND